MWSWPWSLATLHYTVRQWSFKWLRTITSVVPNSRNLSHLWREGGMDEEDDLLAEDGEKLTIEFETPEVSRVSSVTIIFRIRIGKFPWESVQQMILDNRIRLQYSPIFFRVTQHMILDNRTRLQCCNTVAVVSEVAAVREVGGGHDGDEQLLHSLLLLFFSLQHKFIVE